MTMPKLKIRLYPDGTSTTETIGVKGASCKKLIPLIEELTSSESVACNETPEFYEDAYAALNNNQSCNIEEGIK